MLLVLLATFCGSLTAGRVLDGEFTLVNGEEGSLQWPYKYTVKARRISLISNLVEEFVYWTTNQSSRLDSNQGAVKSFNNLEAYRESYQIHPETDKEENIALVCSKFYDETLNVFDEILPDVETYEYIAKKNETVNDYNAVRFEYIYDLTDEDSIHTLWAIDEYDEVCGENVWMPIRYEVKEFNNILGSLTKHDIWDYYDFFLDFDEDDVFNIEPYGCLNENVLKVHSDSDAVTKELKFINTEKKHHVDHVFNSFKNKFNRKYAQEKEHNLRRSIFKQNMRLISSTNRQPLGFKLGINQFADRTHEELKKRNGLLRRPRGKLGNKPFPYNETTLKGIVEQLPTEVDLRLQGLVSPVLDQGECSSCWTYGTTSAVEGALARANGGRLMSLSNQAIIDCAWGFGGGGCDGGTDSAAYEWIMEYGLPTVQDYGSYQNKDGFCHIMNMNTTYPIKGYTDVTPYSNEALKVALFNHGPVAVSVEATEKFCFYSSGIFYEKDCGPESVDHEVTLIGYGEQYGELFWILKNSYGVHWGNSGFMLISAKDNDCGVTTKPTYAVY